MKHNTRSIGSILESVLRDINADDPVAKKRIINEWQEIMDPRISKVCHPVNFTENNVLILEAISESWKNELINLKPIIMKTLKSKFNQLKIKDIKIL
ncbi:hypothetical protein DRI50_00265 [candidate division KSB1 bacterium]|nr:MAG: hypothetical protein DRI50_00265 [candidate division KSB1 bacterium]